MIMKVHAEVFALQALKDFREVVYQDFSVFVKCFVVFFLKLYLTPLVMETFLNPDWSSLLLTTCGRETQTPTYDNSEPTL